VTSIAVILQRERWRNMVTYAGTIAELTWDDLDFGNLTDSRHFHISSFYQQRVVAGTSFRIVSPEERYWTYFIAGHE
jgi:hypothetical protein